MALEYSRVTVAPLWTVEEYKTLHGRITAAYHDADIAQKLGAAQEAIVAYLGEAADPAWTPETAPLMVKHAILLLTTYYFRLQRGDVADPKATETIWTELQHGLGRHRDPTVR